VVHNKQVSLRPFPARCLELALRRERASLLIAGLGIAAYLIPEAGWNVRVKNREDLFLPEKFRNPVNMLKVAPFKFTLLNRAFKPFAAWIVGTAETDGIFKIRMKVLPENFLNEGYVLLNKLLL
jgi:hypothetical protein